MNPSESSKDTAQNRAEQPVSDDHQSTPTSTPIESSQTKDGINTRLTQLQSHLPKQRRGWIWIGGAIAALLIVGGVGWRWWQGNQAQEQAAEAQPPGTPVKIAPIQSSSVADSSQYVASLFALQVVPLRPQVEGRVSRILALSGSPVRAGAPIIQIDPAQQQAVVSSNAAAAAAARENVENARSTLSQLEAERISALSDIRYRQRQYQRYASLASQGAVTRQQSDENLNNFRTAQANLGSINNRIRAQRATAASAQESLLQAQANTKQQQVQLQYYQVNAPFDGTIGNIPIKVGDYVTPSTDLVTITQNRSLEANVSVPTEEASRLRIGLPVELINPQDRVVGTSRISFIAPDVSNQTQSILVKSVFNNSGGSLRTSEFTRARIIWDQRPGLLIPVTAITRLGGESFVFVAEPAPPPPQQEASEQQAPPAQPKLIARQKPVELGNIQGNNYQVLSGLRPGERLIVSGILQLKDGAPVVPGS